MGHEERQIGFIGVRGRRTEFLAVGLPLAKAQRWVRHLLELKQEPRVGNEGPQG